MTSRGVLLAFSVAASLAGHALLIALAPQIQLLGRSATAETLPRPFRVRLIDPVEAQRYEVTSPDAKGQLTTRPGSLFDLLNEDRGRLIPPDSVLDEQTPIPDLTERLNSDYPPTGEEPGAPENMLARIDAKILEISEEAARKEVQVTRRLVAPSPTRILGEGEWPVLRGMTRGPVDETLMIEPLAPGASLEPDAARSPSSAGPNAEPVPPPPPARPEPPVSRAAGSDLPALPELPVEQIVARAPVVRDLQREQTHEFIDDLVNLEMTAYVPPGERTGYFRLQIVPKSGESIPPLPKDVTFIIDASSSIVQYKLDQTVKGVRNAIQSLRDHDRFNVVIFRDVPTLFQPGLTFATADMKAAAMQFLKDVRSRGETNVYAGIRPVITEPPREGVPGIVLVMSDGKPTTGIVDGRTVINAVTAENADKYSIYAFGGGRTVNQHLLDLLAYRNKGEAQVTARIETIGSELPRFFGRLQDPILVQCSANFGRIDERDVFPKQIPDFYKGQAVTLYGRFDPTKDREFALRLSGRAGEHKKEVVFRADLTKAAGGGEEIARNWAFRKIYHLIGEVTRSGETPELLAEIRSLGRQYNIRTSYDR